MTVITKRAPLGLLQAVRAYLPEFDYIPDCYVAGGFIRSFYAILDDPAKDLDLFFKNDQAFGRAIKFMESKGWVSCAGIVGDMKAPVRVVTYVRGDSTVQLVRFGYGPKEAIARFDFTVCAASFYIDGNGAPWLAAAPAFHTDVNEGNLNPVGFVDPVRSLKRMARLMDVGYKPTPATVERLADAVATEFSKLKADAGCWEDYQASEPIPANDEYDPFAEAA